MAIAPALPLSAPSSAAPPPRILLVDADAFFVAVARLTDPDGAGKARCLIVGGRPGGRGVVCSASYEAREFGVRSAMPIARAERLCPQATFVPVPRGACSRKSREIAAVLRRFAPVVQAASIDEWYVDLSGTEALYRHASLAEVAVQLREAVRAETGLLVSCGGGTNTLIAKLAVEHAKPKPGSAGTGVFVVPPGGEAAFMQRVALADIPGVGPRLRDRLARAGLHSVPDALAAGLPALERLLGARAGQWLHERATGRGRHEVELRPHARSVSHEETFPHDLTDDADLEAALLRSVTRVAAALRAKGLAARTVTVKLKDREFRTRSASRSVESPVVSDRVFLAVARPLLHALRRRRRTPVRLLGVGLSGLSAGGGPAQLSLFTAPSGQPTDETAKDRALASAVDTLRERFGADAIVPGPLLAVHERRDGDGTPSAATEASIGGGRRPARGRGVRPSGR